MPDLYRQGIPVFLLKYAWLRKLLDSGLWSCIFGFLFKAQQFLR